MSDYFIRKFIREHNNVKKPEVRYAYGLFVSVVGIIANLLLFAVKILIGILANSISIISDAFNNLSDVGSSLVTLIGFKAGSKPPDEEHPFGHGRIEYISALIVSFIILLLGYEFLKSSVQKIFSPEDIVFSFYTLLILFVAIAVKLLLGRFNKSIGARINSKTLEASGSDAFNDCITTGATIFSMLFFYFTHKNIDGYIGVVVSLFVLYSGYSIAKDSLSTLLGESIDFELAREIKEKVLSYNGIIGVHDLIVHNYGPSNSMATIHAEVPSDIDIQVSHETIDTIEKDIASELGIFTVIHMDPVEMNDERITALSGIVREVIGQYDPNLNAHDFRVVSLSEGLNFIFDLEVPFDYSEKQKKEVSTQIRQQIFSYNERFNCVINMETAFVKSRP